MINNIRISEGKGLLNLQDSSDLAEEIVNLSGKELSGKELIANFIQTTIPQWSNLSQDGFMQLFLLLKGLGLDYERRLKKMETMEGDEIQNLQLELKKTLKGILLSLLEGGDSKENENSLANRLLERITGQQILLQGGSYDTPFYLMEIPLQLEGELYTQTLAIKASRKGKKLDLDHCRLALHAETPSLGELGLEGWLYESQLTLKLFSHSPDQVDPLIQENYSYTRELFRQMGITLNPISVAPLKTAEEFQRFLRGELCEGVDYQV